MKWRETKSTSRRAKNRRRSSSKSTAKSATAPEPQESAEAAPDPKPKSTPKPKARKRTPKAKPKEKKLSRLSRPDDMSLEDWQRALRRQFGREQNYQLKNLGEHRIFSEHEVLNPETRRAYRVQIRGLDIGDNHCTCPDFTTNTLGTCKHIEFVLSCLERKRGGKKELKEGFQPPWSEIFLHYGVQREVRFRPGEQCPVELARLSSRYFDEEGTLRQDAFARFELFLQKAKELEEDLRCQEDVLSFVAEVRDAERRQELVNSKFPRGARSAAFKKLLNVQLYDYQKAGALFAAKAGRCLIGDEMGLGKTIQAIAAAEIMAQLYGVERALIICPTSLKHQWEREIERFSKRSVQVINGLQPARREQFDTGSFFKVTNYDTVHRDLDIINGWSPDLVILDEAQRIKNWQTRTARSVKQVRSPYAIVLTGTPLENRLEELISIVQFVDQYRLGPTFKLLHAHQDRDAVGKVTGYRDLHKIGETLEPVLLRRHKKEVLDQLPDRLDSQIFLPMSAQQRELHDENMEIVARIVHRWREHGFLSEADQQRLMIALQRMRMSCDSTYLVDHTTDHGYKADEARIILSDAFEDPETKVVIFSQWKRMLELLQRRFNAEEWGYVFFHGGVPSKKRKDLIDQFREDPKCRIFLSTDSGGTGLNLQHANMVMNMDMPWNPAVLEQRIGRVHRLGQTNPVRVINFVAQGSIEESMLDVLRFKTSLFSGVLDGGESNIFLGGSRLNGFMKSVEKITDSIPPVTLDDADQAYHNAPRSGEQPPPRGRDHGAQRSSGRSGTPAPQPESPPADSDPWSSLLQAGMAILQQVVGASQQSQSSGRPGAKKQSTDKSQPGSIVQTDKDTGETYIKLPMPAPEVLDQVLQTVSNLLGNFRKD